MKKLLMPMLLFISCLSLLTLHAQSVKFTLGPTQNMNTLGEELGVDAIGNLGLFRGELNYTRDTLHEKSYLITGSDSKSEYGITTYTDYVTNVGTKKTSITATTASQKVDIKRIFSLKNKQYVFYSITDKKQDKVVLYLSELDANMAMVGSAITLVSGDEDDDFYLKLSADNKHIIVNQTIWVRRYIKLEALKYILLDENLMTLGTKVLTNEDYGKDFSASELEVDVNGNIYQLGFRESFHRKPVICRYEWKTDKVVVTPIKYKEKEKDLVGCEVKRIAGHDGPIIIGLFEENKKLSYVVYSVDPTTGSVSLLKANVLPQVFSENFRDIYYESKVIAIENIVALVNGDIVFSIELNDYFTVTSSSHTVYTSGAVGVVSIKKDGTENWARLVQKLQVAPNGYLSRGHLLIPAGDHVLVLYNDNPENIIKKVDDGDIFKYDGSQAHTAVFLQQINNQGEAKKEMVLAGKDSEGFVLSIGSPTKISTGLYQVHFVKHQRNLLIKAAIMEVID